MNGTRKEQRRPEEAWAASERGGGWGGARQRGGGRGWARNSAEGEVLGEGGRGEGRQGRSAAAGVGDERPGARRGRGREGLESLTASASGGAVPASTADVPTATTAVRWVGH